MDTGTSAEKQQKLKLFETILSSPGMNETCKISFKLSRQNLLLLCRLIEVGIVNPLIKIDDDILNVFPDQSVKDFKVIYEEVLQKEGLAEFYERLVRL